DGIRDDLVTGVQTCALPIFIQYVTDRPGHDRRYAMDCARIRRALGWAPHHDFAAGLGATVEWYLTHRPWWERVLSEAYRTAAAKIGRASCRERVAGRRGGGT